MAQTKNLCAQISLELHNRVCEERERSGLTTAQYITNLLTEYFKMKVGNCKIQKDPVPPGNEAEELNGTRGAAEKGTKREPSETGDKAKTMTQRKSGNEFSGAAGKLMVVEFVCQQDTEQLNNAGEEKIGFTDLVEKITAESPTHIRFHLHGGIELTEQLREDTE